MISKRCLFILCTKLYLHTITGTRQSFSRAKRENFCRRRGGSSRNTKESKGEMNGRDESFSVSIFSKATGKKVDEIVPFTWKKEREGGGRREKTQLLVILSRGKFADGDLRMRFYIFALRTTCHLTLASHCSLILPREAERALSVFPPNSIHERLALTAINCSQTNTNSPCIRHGNFASINLISLNPLTRLSRQQVRALQPRHADRADCSSVDH